MANLGQNYEDDLTNSSLVFEEKSVISISSLWSCQIGTPLKKIALADQNYDKFYLPAYKLRESKKIEKLNRQLQKASILTSKELDTLLVRTNKIDPSKVGEKPAFSRLEKVFEENVLGPLRNDRIKYLELIERNKQQQKESNSEKVKNKQKFDLLNKKHFSKPVEEIRQIFQHSCKEKAIKAKEKRIEIDETKQLAYIESIKAKELKRRQYRSKKMLHIVNLVNIAFYFSSIIEDKRKNEILEKEKLDLQELHWNAAILIQKNYILYQNRSKGKNLVEIKPFNLSLFSRNPEMKIESQQIYNQRLKSAKIICTFINEMKNAPITLIRAFIAKVKSIQRYSRAYKLLTSSRILLLSSLMDAFFPQLVIHINVIMYGKLGFDLLETGQSDVPLKQYIKSFPRLIQLQIFEKMNTSGYHSYLRYNLYRITSLMKKELANKGMLPQIDSLVKSQVLGELLSSVRNEHRLQLLDKKNKFPVVEFEKVSLEEVRNFISEGNNPLENKFKSYTRALNKAFEYNKKFKFSALNILSTIKPESLTEAILACIEGTEAKKKKNKPLSSRNSIINRNDTIKNTHGSSAVSSSRFLRKYSISTTSSSSRSSNETTESQYTGSTLSIEEMRENEKYAKRFGTSFTSNLGSSSSRFNTSGLKSSSRLNSSNNFNRGKIASGGGKNPMSLKSSRGFGMSSGRSNTLNISSKLNTPFPPSEPRSTNSLKSSFRRR